MMGKLCEKKLIFAMDLLALSGALLHLWKLPWKSWFLTDGYANQLDQPITEEEIDIKKGSLYSDLPICHGVIFLNML